MMKQEYVELEAEVLRFEAVDVITTSPNPPTETPEEGSSGNSVGFSLF